MVSSKKFIVCYTCWHLAFGFSSCMLISGPQAVGRVWNCWSSDTLKLLFLNLDTVWIVSPALHPLDVSMLQHISFKWRGHYQCSAEAWWQPYHFSQVFWRQSHLKHAGQGTRMERPWPKSMESHKLFSFSFTYSLKSKMENAKRLMPNRKMKFKSLNGKWKRLTLTLISKGNL